jgi:hypothetical protein
MISDPGSLTLFAKKMTEGMDFFCCRQAGRFTVESLVGESQDG